VKESAASGKATKGVSNDECKDLKREDMLDRVWTGVLPIHERVAELVPGLYNRVKHMPEHVVRFVENDNGKNEKYACEAARKPAPEKRDNKEDATE